MNNLVILIIFIQTKLSFINMPSVTFILFVTNCKTMSFYLNKIEILEYDL